MQQIKAINLYKWPLLGVALFSASVFAQTTTNVTVYGVIDVGVEAVSDVAAAGSSESLVRVNQGNMVASRWGVRGTEDLGGGTKAVFNLESGIAPDTGTLLQGGRLFGRSAFAGVQSTWGDLYLGRQRNVIFDLALLYDPLQYASYGLSAFDTSVFLQRVDNSVRYSFKSGGFSTTWHYSFGRDALAGTPAGSQSEVPGNSRIGRQMGVNLNYTKDKIAVGIGYDQQQGATPVLAQETDKRLFIGSTYNLQNTKLYAGYMRRHNEVAAPDVRTNLYWLGINQPLGGQWALASALMHAKQEDSANKASQIAVSLSYALSKQFQWYINAAYVKNDGASTQSINGITPTLPGDSQQGILTGFVYRF